MKYIHLLKFASKKSLVNLNKNLKRQITHRIKREILK